MTDPYRISTSHDTTSQHATPHEASAPSERAATFWWVVLALGIAGNVTTSLMGQSLLGLPFGVAVIVSAVVLAKRHLGRRK